MTDPDVFFSHAESTIYELRKCLELIIIAHETGRYEPLQAAIEAAVIKVAELDMQAVATGELERLRAALTKIEDMEYINQLSGNVNFERAQKIARTALQGDAP